MNITAIIISGLAVGGTGILIGFILGIFGEKFKVEVDEREEAILEVLPGNNCGGCGYAGCSGLGTAIVKGEAPVGQCPVGGSPVAAKIGEIMGVKSRGRRAASCICQMCRNPEKKQIKTMYIQEFGIDSDSGICSKWWTKNPATTDVLDLVTV